MSTTASKQQQAATEGSRQTPHGLHPRTCTTRKSTTFGLQPGNLMICSLDQGERPLRHDGDVDDLDMHINGHVNTKNGTCGIPTVCTQTALNVPVSEHNGHVKLVQELHCGISTGWSGHSLHCAYLSLLPNRERELTQRVSTVVPKSAEYGNVSGKFSQKTPHNCTLQATRGEKWLPA